MELSWNSIAINPNFSNIHAWSDGIVSFGSRVINSSFWEWMQLPWHMVHGLTLDKLSQLCWYVQWRLSIVVEIRSLFL